MIIIDLIYNLSVLVALSIISGFINTRYEKNTIQGKIFQGILFGCVAIIGMMYPFNLIEGVIFDGRSIVISLCTLFFGPLAGLISTILSIIFRNYLGGGGALMGTSVITASFLIGFYFYSLKQKNKFNPTKINLYLFGFIVSSTMLVLMFTLPLNSIAAAFKTVSLTVIIAYPLITLVIGKVLSDQEENKNSIENIIKEKALLRTTLYSIGDAVITTDRVGKIQYMNPIAEKLTGWKEDESFGKSLEEIFRIVNEETSHVVDSPVRRVLKDGSIVGLANHTLLISKDGQETPISDSGAPIKDKNGIIIGVVLVFRDQTEERKNQRKIEQSEARLKRAELASKSGNWELHLESQIVISSEGARKIYGLSEEEFSYESVKTIPLPEYRSLLDNALKNLITKNEPYDIEFKIKEQVSGKIKNIHSTAFYDKDNKILFGIIQDITDKKELEYEKIHLSDILEKSLNEIYVFDSSTLKFEYVNDCALKNLGYTLQEMHNITPVEIKPEYTEAAFRYAVEPLIRGEIDKLTFETVHLRKNGSSYPVEVHLQLHKIENKSVFFAIINDNTERKSAETALRQSEENYRELYEQSPVGYQSLDEDGKFISINGGWLNIFGYEKKDVIGKWFGDFLAPEFVPVFRERFQIFKSKGKIHNEFYMLKKNGEHAYIVFDGRIGYKSNGEFKQTHCVLSDRTEKKKMEDFLRQSEERYRQLADNAPIPVVVAEPKNGNFLYVNKCAYELMAANSDKNNFKDYSVTDFYVNPEQRQVFLKIINEKGSLSNFEVELRTFDGKPLTALVSSILTNFENKPAIFTSFYDITDRKKSAEILALSEANYKYLFENNPHPMWVYELDTLRFLAVNDTAIIKYGYTREEFLLTTIKDIRPESENVKLLKHVTENKSELQFSGPWVHKLKNGSLIFVEISSHSINFSGKDARLIVVNDVTERLKIGDALKESEEKFRNLFESHSAVKLLLDPDTGQIIDANIAAENYYGWSREELRKMKIHQINNFTEEEMNEEIEKATKQNRIHFEFRHNRADGSVRDVEVFSSKIKIGDKFFLHSIIHDITKRKKAEELLERHRNNLEDLVKIRTKELGETNIKLKLEIEKAKEYEVMLQQTLQKEKELSELKSRFISTTSHEFRTPLTAVLSSAELIQRYGRKWSDDKFDYHTTKIKNSIEYLTKLLDDVLTISRSESGKIVFNPTTINLPNLCSELYEESLVQANEKHNIKLDFELIQKEFILDPKLIRFMVVNLLSNAIKYSPEGGLIHFNIKEKKGKLVISISDEGIGIPAEEIHHLFDPFHRARNVIDIPGTGLGLSIVKRAVELHSGEIKVRSEIGKGTIFIIILPTK